MRSVPKAQYPPTIPTIPSQGHLSPTVSTAPPQALAQPKFSSQSSALSAAADRILKDIDQRIRSLPPNELAEIKVQCNALLDASICLINRDEVDPTTLSDQRQDRMREAMNTLHQKIPLTTPKSKQLSGGERGTQFNAIQSTLRQLSWQLSSELRTTLRQANKDSLETPKTKDWGTVRSIAGTLGQQNIDGQMNVFLQSLSGTLLQTESIQQDFHKHPSIPGLSQGDQTVLRSRHAELRGCLSTLLTAKEGQAPKTVMQEALEEMTPEQASQVTEFISWAQQIERHVQLSLDLHDDYRSPDSIESICHARQCEIKAAINVLKADNPAKHRQLITHLETRCSALEDLKLVPDDISLVKLLGEKEISGARRLLHPVDAAKQAVRVEKAVYRILAAADRPGQQVDSHPLELDGFSEPMLMRALLKKQGIDDATAKHRIANREVLDRQSWDVIRSEIVVPIQSEAGLTLQRLESVATPASHILANPERVKHGKDNAVLNPKNVKGYIHDDSQSNSVRGGFNSHDVAEATHAVMATHDELRADGKLLFGATRHGVNAPFGLPDELRSMPPDAAGKQILQLLGPGSRSATIETIRYPNSAPGSSTDTASESPTSIQIPNSILEAFRNRLQQRIDRENTMLEGLNTAGLASSEPSTSPIAVDDLLSNPQFAAVLAEHVFKDAVLMRLLVQQGALNRAREAIIMEIARSPILGSQIARGEPLLFGSISLLTPDHLRHFIASISSGNSSLDEKAMLEIQVQAYKDLQQEIEAGGLIINGQQVKAKILPFNWGVSELSLLKPGNDPVIGTMINGHDVSNTVCNQASLTALVGLPGEARDSTTDNETDRFLASANERLASLESSPRSADAEADAEAEIASLKEALKVIPELRDQIRQIWSDGSYRFAGNEPYKMPARIALLMHYLGGGTLFNCKSGKDRTGQLSVEAKALAVRIMANGGQVPEPDHSLTPSEQVQYGALTFVDKTRTELQRYATGYAGSKLGYARKLLSNLFALTDGLNGRALEQLNRERFREFMGLSKRTKS
jgi:hypothetical protein